MINTLQRIKNIEEKLNRVPPHDGYHFAFGGKSTGMIKNVNLRDNPPGKHKVDDWEIEVTPLCNENCIWVMVPDWSQHGYKKAIR